MCLEVKKCVVKIFMFHDERTKNGLCNQHEANKWSYSGGIKTFGSEKRLMN